jgi:hypothetical protein
LPQTTSDQQRTTVFAAYNLVESFASALGALAVGFVSRDTGGACGAVYRGDTRESALWIAILARRWAKDHLRPADLRAI